jgi:hypothetical protein
MIENGNIEAGTTSLYGLDRLGDARQVIVVGDAECCDALATLTRRVVLSWPGGT